MGYDTRFGFMIQKNEKVSTREILDKIYEMMTTDHDFMYPFDYEVKYSKTHRGWIDESLEMWSDDVHWYEHDEDMIKLSKQFPDVIFHLHGEGESRYDIWDSYYKNGKMVRYDVEITVTPFNEDDLE